MAQVMPLITCFNLEQFPSGLLFPPCNLFIEDAGLLILQNFYQGFKGLFEGTNQEAKSAGADRFKSVLCRGAPRLDLRGCQGPRWPGLGSHTAGCFSVPLTSGRKHTFSLIPFFTQ